ncbi:MAG: hypothetical protein ACRDKG_11835 [Actinomycetota bacterium]
MDRREDMRSHSCDLCGQGFANKKDFEEHNASLHNSNVMTAGSPSDRPQPVTVAAPSNNDAGGQKAEEPKAEEPKAQEPTEDSEEEPTAKAG